MHLSTRRSVMKKFAALLFISAFQNWDITSQEKHAAHRVKAIQIFRFLNTAEFRFSQAFDRYAGLEELRNSDVVDTLVYAGRRPGSWGGRELYESLRVEQDEILPGGKRKYQLDRHRPA